MLVTEILQKAVIDSQIGLCNVLGEKRYNSRSSYHQAIFEHLRSMILSSIRLDPLFWVSMGSFDHTVSVLSEYLKTLSNMINDIGD